LHRMVRPPSTSSVNMSTGLMERAAALDDPFIVVSAQRDRTGNTPLFGANSDEEVFAFMQRTARVFSVDPARVHIGGFSQGGVVTFNILCDPQKAAFIASAAPAATTPGGNRNCFGVGPTFTNPAVPILYFSGTNDGIANFSAQMAARSAITA